MDINGEAVFNTYNDDAAEVALQVVPVVAVVDTNDLVLERKFSHMAAISS